MGFTSFGDTDKSAKDLFKKGFTSKNVVKTKKKTANGITWETETTLGEKVATKLTSKFKTEFVDFEKVCLDSKSNFHFKLSNDTILDGLTSTLETKCTPDKADEASLELSYSHEKFISDINFGLINHETVAALSTGYEGFSFGASVKFEALSFSGYELGVAYGSADSKFSVIATDQLSKLNMALYHKVDDSLTLGATINVPIKEVEKKEDDKPAVSFNVGGKWVIDDQSTIQAKVDCCGVSTIAFHQKLSDGVKAILSTEIDKKLQSKGTSFEINFA